jgi:hypothetical protein
MSLTGTVLATAEGIARFLTAHSRPTQEFVHNQGTLQAWYVCRVSSSSGDTWSASEDVLLTPDGQMHMLYVLEVRPDDPEDRVPTRTLWSITESYVWPDSYATYTWQSLQRMMA